MKTGGKRRDQLKGTFGFGGAYTSMVSKIFDVLMLGVLWLVCSVPLVTIGAASSALYYAIVRSVKEDDGYASTMFFRSFRRNLKQGTILWLVLAALLFLMGLNVSILLEHAEGVFGIVMMGFYGTVGIYLFLTACYLFPALSRFEMNTFWFLRIALYMVARYFPTSFMLAVIAAGGAAIVWRVPVMLFFVPGPAAFLVSEFMERILEKHAP